MAIAGGRQPALFQDSKTTGVLDKRQPDSKARGKPRKPEGQSPELTTPIVRQCKHRLSVGFNLFLAPVDYHRGVPESKRSLHYATLPAVAFGDPDSALCRKKALWHTSHSTVGCPFIYWSGSAGYALHSKWLGLDLLGRSLCSLLWFRFVACFLLFLGGTELSGASALYFSRGGGGAAVRLSCFCLLVLPFVVLHGIMGLSFSFRCFALAVLSLSCPPAVLSLVAAAPAVGFSGSRSLPAVSVAALRSVSASVLPSASVSVGCAAGADAVARGLFPSAQVFSVSSGRWGAGRSAFARRSVAVVSAVLSAGGPAGLWCFFPSAGCPVGLLPSARSSRCFCGLGSGSWASAAFALGSGLPLLAFLPPGVSPPPGWGFSSLGGGWWVARPAAVQLALF
jgi:hypothetical protein